MGYVGQYTTCLLSAPVVLIPLRGQSSFLFLILWMDVWDSLWFQAADNNHWNYTFKVGWDVVGYVGQYTTCLLSAPVVLIPLRGQSSFLFLILWMDVWDSLWFQAADNNHWNYTFKVGWDVVGYVGQYTTCLLSAPVVLIPLRGQSSFLFLILWMDVWDSLWFQAADNNHWNYTFKVGWDVVGYVGQYTTCLLSAPVVLIPLRGQSSFLFLILWMDVWDSLWFQAADNNHWNYTFKVGWDVVGYVGQYTTCLLSAPVVLIPLRGQSSFLFLILWMDVWDSLWFQAADNNHWNYTFKVGWDVVGYVGQYTTCLLSAPVVLIPLRGQSSFLFLILWMDVWDSLWFQAADNNHWNYTFKVGWDVVGYVGQYTTCLLSAPVVLIPLRGQSSFLFLILWMDVWDSLWFQAADNNHWNYTFKVGWDVVGYVGQYTTCLLSAPVVLIPLRGQSSFLFLILWMDVWDSLWFQAADNNHWNYTFKVSRVGCCGLCGTIHNLFAFSSCCVDTTEGSVFFPIPDSVDDGCSWDTETTFKWFQAADNKPLKLLIPTILLK